MKYEIYGEGGYIFGSYELTEFPGCGRVCISHALYIDPLYRGRGFGKKAHKERLEKAKELGFEVILATVVEGNKAQERILEAFKWRRCTVFENLKTGHTVNLWMKHLNDPYEDWIGGCR